jgi:hypothetical protein
MKAVGKTKDAGFQFGLRKTFPVSEQKARDFMFSDAGLKIWLGYLEKSLELKKEYRTKSGIEGFVSVFKPYSHIRMKWKKKDWYQMSIVQVRIIGKENGKTMISFHQEKLANAEQRAEMKAYWNKKMEEIAKEIEKKNH